VECAVAIYRLIQKSAFSPEELERITSAYEKALVLLELDRNDPVTELVAKRIIEAAQTGENDPDRICDLALKVIGVAAKLAD